MPSSSGESAWEKALSGLTRRGFIGGAAAMMGLSGQTPRRLLTPRTLFFNLSHENYTNTSHFLFVAGRTYPLTRVAFNPAVLVSARSMNNFLRAVPDQHITHHLEGVMLPADISTLSYVGSNVNTGTGTWSMSMIVQNLPSESIGQAYARARARHGATGPLPLSAKRAFYGHPPAMTERDFREEQDLVDSTDHARTLIGLHPDLLCAEPNGAAYIHNTHISPNSSTRFLAAVLRSKGAADPQQTPGQPNSRGWATLTPINQDNGQPFKTTTGLNQYFPDWDSTVDQQVAGGAGEIHQEVKDDETLGVDVTSASSPSNPSTSYAGKVWYRHDGVSHVSRSTSIQDDPALQWDFQQKNGEAGLVVSQPEVNASPGSVSITLDNVNNWFLRFLGMWLQFVDPNKNVIPVSQLPTNTIPSRNGQPNHFDNDTTLFGGLISPPFSVAGIPIAPGQFSITVNVPPDAATIKIYYAGFGMSGSPYDPLQITAPGGGMTVLVNYALVSFFMSVGVSTGVGPTVKLITTVVGQVIAQEVVAILGANAFNNSKSVPVGPMMLALLKGVLNGFAGRGLASFVSALLAQLAEAEIIDSVPVAGQIARAAAAVIGAVQLAETTIEVALSPGIYEFDLTLTHDINVTINPDKMNNQFPTVPSGYTLYYKLAYLFDSGSAHTLDAVDLPNPAPPSIQRKLSSLPRGGRVNVMVGFYARQSSTPPGQNDFCAGQGSTGLMDNTVDYTPSNPLTITITQNKIPITSNTKYIHTRKTTLDKQGNHLWTNTPTAPPYIPPPGGQQPGSLGALRSITVRQGTGAQQGYVGYAWQAYSAGFNDCIARAPGQLDQAANLNTDPANAQNGYSTTPCGLQGGATSGLRLSYSLLNDDLNNFYLDTSSLLIRQVPLNPPGFFDPTQGQAFGQLNLDSTRLLLHPAGHIVSINNANHKIEALKLPLQSVADADVPKQYLARTYSGQGSRPGLITSPVAAVISPEGAILVLEDSGGNNRIQAFDLGGNQIQFFKGQPTPYFFSLDATKGATYLDLAVEFTGYLYVLSQEANGGDFRLDIYHPNQTTTQPISTTRGVTAARLCVDFWRSVYTLNSEVLQLPNGGGNPNPPNLTEPSVSLWVPSIPS